MVFNKNVNLKQIEEFENNILQEVMNYPRFVFLQNEIIKKKLICKLEVQHSELDLKKYHSELSINVFNECGKEVCEEDEPICILMLCEPICFMHHNRIVGVELITDKDFLEEIELLIDKICAKDRTNNI